MGVMVLNRLQLARQVRITNFIGVKIGHTDPHTVFHLEAADFVQKRSPLLVSFEVFSHMLGKQNVADVTAIHHPLRQVDSDARQVGPFVYVGNFANWTAVDSHPNWKTGMFRSARLISSAHRAGSSALV